jgi:hypothetical protein
VKKGSGHCSICGATYGDVELIGTPKGVTHSQIKRSNCVQCGQEMCILCTITHSCNGIADHTITKTRAIRAAQRTVSKN